MCSIKTKISYGRWPKCKNVLVPDTNMVVVGFYIFPVFLLIGGLVVEIQPLNC